jgi:hypothetical protein
MVNDITENFARQPISHIVRGRKSRTMFCDFCNPARMLVWHAEQNRILCPQCGQTPQILQDKLAELDKIPEPGTEENRPKLVTSDGFESQGQRYNLTSMRMRAKYGPRSLSTVDKSEFGEIDSDTQEMLERNPSYRLVDYKEKIE